MAVSLAPSRCSVNMRTKWALVPKLLPISQLCDLGQVTFLRLDELLWKMEVRTPSQAQGLKSRKGNKADWVLKNISSFPSQNAEWPQIASLPTFRASLRSLGGSVSFTKRAALGVIKTDQPRPLIPKCTLAVQSGPEGLYILKSSGSTMVCCFNRVAEPRTV